MGRENGRGERIVDGRESFVVGGRIGFSGLALNRFGRWALRGGPSVRPRCILLHFYYCYNALFYFFYLFLYDFYKFSKFFKIFYKVIMSYFPLTLPTGRVCHGPLSFRFFLFSDRRNSWSGESLMSWLSSRQPKTVHVWW